MLTCPMCKKTLPGMEKKCANCKTDVSLLVDYVDNLRDGLERAEQLTRQGELGDAVWEYLEVLEVDPDNAHGPASGRQGGDGGAAVRPDRPRPALAEEAATTDGRSPLMANWSSDGDGNTLARPAPSGSSWSSPRWWPDSSSASGRPGCRRRRRRPQRALQPRTAAAQSEGRSGVVLFPAFVLTVAFRAPIIPFAPKTRRRRSHEAR